MYELVVTEGCELADLGHQVVTIWLGIARINSCAL